MPARVGRLKQRSQFLRVAAARKKWVTPGLILQTREQAVAHAPTNLLSTPVSDLRVGFTASKKVGNSVARNRARRRLKAAVQTLFSQHAKSDMDYVLIGRQGTLGRPWDRLVRDLKQAMVKLDVWQDEAQEQLQDQTS